ncbi:leucine-rich repeat domain-containing protein, partial [Candidatus Saccharibacteria bacterium]|nr:leucine-rich repeat domain-containing protein [Candidatus Saccharibacteria bacterium]
HLTSIPSEFGQLTNLRRLSLSNNQLTSLPSEFFQLVNLRDLWFNDNRLATIPLEISRLTDLQELWLDNNHFTIIPFEISRLSNLWGLYMNNFPNTGNVVKNMRIQNIKNIIHLTGLRNSSKIVEKNIVPSQIRRRRRITLLEIEASIYFNM